MRRLLAIGAVTAAAIAVLAAQDAPQTFRTRTDVVMVDVNVRSGGKNITGLTADDFVLTDNGARQKIESVEATAVPIDVTLVVDVSGNTERPWIDRRPDPSKTIQRVTKEVAEVAAILRPTDRVRLLTIDRYVRQVFPLRSRDAIPVIRTLDFDGLPSLHDGLTAALLQPGEAARRHVVVARLKGVDSMSVLDPEAVRAIAERSDVLFHLVMMETEGDNESVLSRFQCANIGLCWPVNRFWVPATRYATTPTHQLSPDGEMLRAGAEATGGKWHQTELFSVPSLVGTFKDTFENFRSGYMLRYTPTRSEPGWHRIQVSVPKSRSYEVSARRGYGVDERQPRPQVVPAPTSTLTTLAQLVGAYERRAFSQTVLSIRQTRDPARLLQDFEAGGNPWPGTPAREAAFALDLLEPALFSSRKGDQEQAYRLLDRFARLIRHPLEPTRFEREWTFASLTLLQGAVNPAVTNVYIDRAIQRFPDEPWFLLLKAINSEQASLVGTRVSVLQASGSLARPATLDALREHYERAMAFSATSTEARIRLGWLLHRGGKAADAVTMLRSAAATPISDPALRYLQQLFLGHALVAAEKTGEAIVAFRSAMALMPEAPSARVALMNVLMLHGDRSEAEALAEQIQADKSTAIDPWWMYWQGLYRIHPHAMALVRESAK